MRPRDEGGSHVFRVPRMVGRVVGAAWLGVALTVTSVSSVAVAASFMVDATDDEDQVMRPRATEPRAGRRVLIIDENLQVPRDRRVWQECLALAAAGYRVSVICPMAAGDPPIEYLEGIALYRYPPAPASSGTMGFFYEFAYSWARALLLTLKVLRKEGFDVIQACNPPDIYFTIAWLYKPFGKRFVYDQHDLAPETYQARFKQPSRALLRGLYLLERLTYRTADRVIATNHSYRDVALARGGKAPEHVVVVRNGPDPTQMRRGPARPELRNGRRYLCCYLGIMGPQDGVDLAVRAADVLVHQMGRHDCSFALLGDGDSYQEVQALVQELGLQEYVTMPGFLEHDQLTAYLSTADLGLCPEPSNPLNEVSTMVKTMEYMAFELPVVAFNLKETRFSAADAAVYVTPNEVKQFAAAIAALLDDPDRRATMGRAGRRHVEEALAWPHQAPTYVDVFDQLTGTGRVAGSGNRLTASLWSTIARRRHHPVRQRGTR
jgi:glycosyltransferase involved in cell wall biosynthesis